MHTTFIINIGILVNVRESNELLRGSALQQLPALKDAWLQVEEGKIVAYGEMQHLVLPESAAVIDAKGGAVLPGWCDSHTHIVFAASREDEFVDKIKGLSYADIAAKGGGILNSAAKLRNMPEDALYDQSYARLQELIQLGTTAIEIKSGYGLTVESELKMLRVINRLKQSARIPVKATFLGAHAIPPEYKNNREGYIDLVINEMLPNIAKEKLADYIDVFCEEGFFTPDETRRICLAGIDHGLEPKIHANQLHASGGVETGVELGAVSVDHLETMNESAIAALSNFGTIGTLLPTAAFFLRMGYPPVRELINRNCAIALASDFNPGSSPGGNMNFVVALSCIQMKMLPEEAINAATINGAYAMEVQNEVGSISIGKKANLIITRPISSIAYLPYAFSSNLIERVLVNGK